jgi:prophage regulatory protein
MNKQIKFIRYRDLNERYGISFSRRHLDRLEAEGKFPKRVRLSKYLVVWVDDEVAAYAARHVAARELEITV